MSESQPRQLDKSTSNEPEFFIQVGGTASSGVTPQMSVQDFIAGSKEQFKKIADVVEAAGQAFIQRISTLASKPTECSIEFGINAGGEAGVPFVTKGTVGANFTVTISWKTEPQ